MVRISARTCTLLMPVCWKAPLDISMGCMAYMPTRMTLGITVARW